MSICVDARRTHTVVTAVMHKLVGPTGLIIGIDHLPGLVEMSKNNLAADGLSVSVSELETGAKEQRKTGDAYGGKALGETGVKVILGDGREGCSPFGQFSSPRQPFRHRPNLIHPLAVCAYYRRYHCRRIPFIPLWLRYTGTAPYKAIHVGAASPIIPPALLAQLDSPGRMFIPVGSAEGKQVIKVVTKDAEGRVEVEDVMDVRVSSVVC
jgi:protein-L-isoaspartate(D-aspartate) O-methyltransferase